MEPEIREHYECDMIQINTAVYCDSCKRITSSTTGKCARCGDEALQLAPILDRKPVTQRPLRRAGWGV